MAINNEILITLALQMEKFGLEFYGRLLDYFDKKSIEYKVIAFLINEESEHITYFKKLREIINDTRIQLKKVSKTDIAHLKNVVRDRMVKNTEKIEQILKHKGNYLPILFFGMKIELDNIFYYESNVW